LTSDKVAAIVSDFQYIAAHYFSNASYLTLGQARPVVYFYVSRALAPVSAIQPMVSSVRQAMTAAGFDVYLIGDEYYAPNPPDPARIGNWDGIFGYDTYAGYAGYSDDNGFLALHTTMYAEYQAAAQQLGVDFIPSLTPGYNDRAVRQTCANNPALARRTNANAAEGSMFSSFLNNLALPYANNSRFKMIHITTFNEWHEDTQIEPSVGDAQETAGESEKTNSRNLLPVCCCGAAPGQCGAGGHVSAGAFGGQLGTTLFEPDSLTCLSSKPNIAATWWSPTR
jgi:glycoprotein endo-alpha-1,2-mannosidase